MNIKSIFQVAQHLFFGVVTSLSAAMPTVSATMLQQPPSTPPPAVGAGFFASQDWLTYNAATLVRPGAIQ